MTEPTGAAVDPGPGSLGERANQALLALADRADRKKTEAERSAITTACNRAEKFAARLAACARIGAQLESLDVEYVRPRVPQPAVKAIPYLRRVATQAADPGQELTERLRGGAVQGALEAAETIAKLLEQALIRAADAERARVTPADFGRPIPNMPGHESLQARISRIKASLSRPFVGSIDDVPATLERWRRDAAQWDDVRDEIGKLLAELPLEIKAFVEAAASDSGAPWSMVTPAVREWLDNDRRGDGYGVRKW
ncbi:hypothetical protein [Micromonospora sp. U21]|uniref:hypothetical protein n=1 Tax=Micromonospora sp. U21 TaxID=2824899 RepID=UPI001B391D63|nr:hypothetical protein [Micromonospora sp. U21]MBQ0903145.1 hypothetical protein [Micromonospora sp. U21]